MLGVTTRTILRWERDGKVVCQRTPGGHRRLWLTDVRRLQGLMTRTERG